MKTQQAAEREEQQRIKSLVLNYDLRDGEEQQDGDSALPIRLDPNIHIKPAGIEKAATHSRSDKPARAGQRARKLQLSDVTDWYDFAEKPQVSHFENVSRPRLQPSRVLSSTFPNYSPLGSLQTISSQRDRTRPRTNGRGRLTKREIEQEHASRKAAPSRHSE
jgi:regulator of nonsense transcripts 2